MVFFKSDTHTHTGSWFAWSEAVWSYSSFFCFFCMVTKFWIHAFVELEDTLII